MIKKLLFTLVVLLQFSAFSQSNLLSENAAVSVFTCGRGGELYSTFGHTAIRIKDNFNNLDVVYNYGAFDFRTENFYLKFVKGDLQYFINASTFDDFIYEYQLDNRQVVEQTLDLSSEQKQKIYQLLSSSLTSEERNYTYKFIDRNCTTKVVDKINTVLGKTVIEKVDDKTISYRQVLYPYFDSFFWYKFGINIIFGAKTDHKAEKLFLPIELLNSLDKAIVGGKPLVSKKEIIVKGGELKTDFSFFNSIYPLVLLLILVVLSRKKIIYLSYFFILGLLGLFFCLVGFYSFHEEILWNYNVLLFNPLFLVLPFIKGKWLKNSIKISMGMLLIYCILMINKPYVTLMIPFILVSGYILNRLLKDFKKAQK